MQTLNLPPHNLPTPQQPPYCIITKPSLTSQHQSPTICQSTTTHHFHSLYIPSDLTQSVQKAATTTSTSSLNLWHARLGHASVGRIQTLVSSGLLGSVNNDNFDCLTCQIAKQPALPFNKSVSVSSNPFDLIHSDVWGPSPTTTKGGSLDTM